MSVTINTTWANKNPNSVWNKLVAKLGREPTEAEARDEVLRIIGKVKA